MVRYRITIITNKHVKIHIFMCQVSSRVCKTESERETGGKVKMMKRRNEFSTLNRERKRKRNEKKMMEAEREFREWTTLPDAH